MAYLVDKQLFKTQFGNHTVPKLLLDLLDFQNQAGTATFPEGFHLDIIDKPGLQTFSDKQVWLHAFVEFAKANGTGSTYAFWLIHDEPEQCPIVAFGDEGGMQVIAQDLPELLHLTTFNTEIMVDWNGAYFFREQSNKPEPKPLYRQWIKEHTGLESLTTNELTNAIITLAKSKYQEQLEDFARQFGDF